MDIKLMISKAREENRGLFEIEAMDILKGYGINVPNYRLAKLEEDAVIMAREIGYPVVMKIVSRDILHKTDSGCVKLNLKNDEEVKSAYKEIIYNAKEVNKEVCIEGVVIYPLVPKGIEVIIGVTDDDQFGSAIMFGLGGIFIEVLKDVVFRIIPVTEQDTREMIKEIVDVVLKISKLVLDFPEIREIDLNPIYVYDEGLTVVDARILVT